MKRFPFAQTFFGLTPSHKGSYVLEELFQLVYNGKMSLADAQRLPVYQRRWFIQRLIKEYEEEKKANEKAMRKGKP